MVQFPQATGQWFPGRGRGVGLSAAYGQALCVLVRLCLWVIHRPETSTAARSSQKTNSSSLPRSEPSKARQADRPHNDPKPPGSVATRSRTASTVTKSSSFSTISARNRHTRLPATLLERKSSSGRMPGGRFNPWHASAPDIRSDYCRNCCAEVTACSQQLLRNAFYDLADVGVALTPGGVYRLSKGNHGVVFKIDPSAKPGKTPIVGRLLRFDGVH